MTTRKPTTKAEDVMSAIDEGRIVETRRRPNEVFADADTAPLIEALADVEHQRWADWQRYFMGKLDRLEDGRLVIPVDYEDALRTLIETPYADLDDDIKASDRKEVERYWSIVEQFIAGST